MKRIQLITFALLLTISSFGQDRLNIPDHFEFTGDYHQRVEREFGFDVNIKFGYIVRPSFEKEYGVYCKIDDIGAEFVASTPEKMIWTIKTDSVRIITKRFRISRAQAGKFETLFKYAIESSSYVKDKDRLGMLGLDGTTYSFYSDRRIAKIWSPSNGGAMPYADRDR